MSVVSFGPSESKRRLLPKFRVDDHRAVGECGDVRVLPLVDGPGQDLLRPEREAVRVEARDPHRGRRQVDGRSVSLREGDALERLTDRHERSVARRGEVLRLIDVPEVPKAEERTRTGCRGLAGARSAALRTRRRLHRRSRFRLRRRRRSRRCRCCLRRCCRCRCQRDRGTALAGRPARPEGAHSQEQRKNVPRREAMKIPLSSQSNERTVIDDAGSREIDDAGSREMTCTRRPRTLRSAHARARARAHVSRCVRTRPSACLAKQSRLTGVHRRVSSARATRRSRCADSRESPDRSRRACS